MPKFVITQIDRYLVEADSVEQVEAEWRARMLAGIEPSDDYCEYLDGSTTYEEEN